MRELVNHIVTGNYWAFELAGGKTIEDVGTALDGDVLGTDPLRAYDDSSLVAAAVFREPGAGPSLRGVVGRCRGRCAAGTASSTCWSTDGTWLRRQDRTPGSTPSWWRRVGRWSSRSWTSSRRRRVRHHRDPARRRRAAGPPPRRARTRRASRWLSRGERPHRRVTCGLTEIEHRSDAGASVRGSERPRAADPGEQ